MSNFAFIYALLSELTYRKQSQDMTVAWSKVPLSTNFNDEERENFENNSFVTELDKAGLTIVEHEGVYHVYDATDSGSSGFYAVISKIENKTVIAFRGTDFNPGDLGEIGDLEDIATDIFVGGGAINDPQLLQTLALVNAVSELETVSNDNLVLTGHSLGGGLAGIAAKKFGIEGHIFGPAPFGGAIEKLLRLDAVELIIEQYPDKFTDKFKSSTDDAKLYAFNLNFIIPTTHHPEDYTPFPLGIGEILVNPEERAEIASSVQNLYEDLNSRPDTVTSYSTAGEFTTHIGPDGETAGPGYSGLIGKIVDAGSDPIEDIDIVYDFGEFFANDSLMDKIKDGELGRHNVRLAALAVATENTEQEFEGLIQENSALKFTLWNTTAASPEVHITDSAGTPNAPGVTGVGGENSVSASALYGALLNSNIDSDGLYDYFHEVFSTVLAAGRIGEGINEDFMSDNLSKAALTSVGGYSLALASLTSAISDAANYNEVFGNLGGSFEFVGNIEEIQQNRVVSVDVNSIDISNPNHQIDGEAIGIHALKKVAIIEASAALSSREQIITDIINDMQIDFAVLQAAEDGAAMTFTPDSLSSEEVEQGRTNNHLILSGTGSDEITGGETDDIILAGKGDDVISGGLGNDMLFGEEGQDVFLASSGKDHVYGGGKGVDEHDTLDFSELTGLSNGVTIKDAKSYSSLEFANFINFHDENDLASEVFTVGVERVIATNLDDRLVVENNNGWGDVKYIDFGGQASDSEFGDVLDFQNSDFGVSVGVLDPNDAQLQIAYLDAPEHVSGGRADNVETIIGSSDDDVIFATEGVKNISGGAGNDVLRGGRGAITIDAGEGNSSGGRNHQDVISITHGDTVINADENDVLNWGGMDIHGGTQLWYMEGGWATWSPIGSLVYAMPQAFLNAFGAIAPLGVLANQFEAMSSLLFHFKVLPDEEGEGHNLYIQSGAGFLAGKEEGYSAWVNNYVTDLSSGAATASALIFKQSFSDEAGSLGAITRYLDIAFKASFGVKVNGDDPLVLDLDGDGIELVRRSTSDIHFDIDADGFAENVGWVASDDGFLAHDKNGNGLIDDVNELFGDATTSGFEALSLLDSNSDGVINASDSQFLELSVWRDLNQDGKTDFGELFTLEQVGITEISLSAENPEISADQGNDIRQVGSFTRADGTTSTVADVALEVSQLDSESTSTQDVSSEAAEEMAIKGRGTLEDLQIAMTNDASLLQMVQSFSNLSPSTSWNDLKEDVSDILMRWAGIDGMNATAIADSEFDTQQLAFLEIYTGEELVQRDLNGDPLPTGISELSGLWDKVLSNVTIRLASDGPLAELLSGAEYYFENDAFLLSETDGLQSLIEVGLSNLSADSELAANEWASNWGPLINSFTESGYRNDQVQLKIDYVVQAFIAASENTPHSLSLDTLLLPIEGRDSVTIGTDQGQTLTRPVNDEITHVFTGGTGNDTFVGGEWQDVVVLGSDFGQDTFEDTEYLAKGDRIRFSTYNADEVTITRDGDDLLITVNGTDNSVRVIGQYATPASGATSVLGIGSAPSYGIEDIQFADGTIFEKRQIAELIGSGTDQDEIIDGTIGEDIITGNGGNDILRGSDSGDVYVYSLGDGQDVIQDVRTNATIQGGDALTFFGGIYAEDVTVSREGDSEDLVIHLSDGGSVTLEGQAVYSPVGYGGVELDSRVEMIMFSDGPAWDWYTLQQQSISTYTTDEADQTYGFGTADEFFASAGNDLLVGFDGNDYYHFGYGSGHDQIDEQQRYIDVPIASNQFISGLGSQTDTLIFDGDITAQDVVFSRVNAGADLLVTLQETGETMLVKGQFEGKHLDIFGILGDEWFNRVENFQFSDDTIITWDQIIAELAVGDAQDNELFGALYGDTLDGKAGDDTLSGGDGGDIYLFGRDYGHDVIDDNQEYVLEDSADTVKFAEGISVEDVTFERDGNSDDLVIRIAGDSGSLRIKGQYDVIETGPFGTRALDQVENFEWADGTVLSWSELRQTVIDASATSGDDTIYGSHFDDDIQGGAGDDYLSGGNGSDTYHFNSGDGDERIFDGLDNLLSGNQDRLVFSDLTAAELSFQRSGEQGQDILITHSASSSSVLIEDQLAYSSFGSTGQEIEEIEFSDGAVWSALDLRQTVLDQSMTSGDDYVSGYWSHDLINGGAGDDILEGGDGSDTYSFDIGFGNDIIREDVGNIFFDDFDRIEFGDGFESENIRFTRSGLDLTINFVGMSDQIVIEDQFKASAFYGGWNDIEEISFVDGTTITSRDIRLEVLNAQSTDGDDVIEGFFTSDRISGGLGDDTLMGSSGGDIYEFNIGDGHDTIIENLVDHPWLDGPDTVEFGNGITFTDLQFERSGDDYIITLSSGDAITIQGHFANSSKQIERLKFADGTGYIITEAGPVPAILPATGEDSSLIGTSENDLLESGAGNDTLTGLQGDDTYVFNLGDGQDLIIERGDFVGNGGEDILIFGEGITSDMVSVSRFEEDLTLTINGTTDKVTIRDYFETSGFSASLHWDMVERISFADGVVWEFADIRAKLIESTTTAGNDVSRGFWTADTLGGDAGNDELRGSTGGDTYLFGEGSGHDTIYESLDHHIFLDNPEDQPDVVLFAEGLSLNDLIFSHSGNDVVITIEETGETLTVTDNYNSTSSFKKVEIYRFADGTELSPEQLQRLIIEGQVSDGDDDITAGRGNDVLEGGRGNDILRGEDGDDTYVYNLGDGHDVIAEPSIPAYVEYDNKDVLVFGEGLSHESLIIERINERDLRLSFEGVEGSVIVERQFDHAYHYGGESWWSIEEFIFADGTKMTDEEIRLAVINSQVTSGNDLIIGSFAEDILMGSTGDDQLRGGLGGDTYVYSIGDGNDVIHDDSIKGSIDRLVFTGELIRADVTFRRVDEDLKIEIHGTDDVLTIENQFNDGQLTYEFDLIENFEFSNGVIFTYNDVIQAVVESQATAVNDVITGYFTDEALDGFAGDDLLIGLEGNDTYKINLGGGNDVIEDRSSSEADEVKFGNGILADQIDYQRVLDDLVLTLTATGEVVTIKSQFAANGQGIIEAFNFEDGTVLTASDIEELAQNQIEIPDITHSGTSGNDSISSGNGDDVISGDQGNDNLYGKKGSDTYIYREGDGSDYIRDNEDRSSDADTLFFIDLNLNDIVLHQLNEELRIEIISTGDVIRVEDQFGYSFRPYYGIENIKFADGTILDKDQIRELALVRGTDGDDVISGGSKDEYFFGGLGDDELRGSSGSDKYIYRNGDGSDIINDNSSSSKKLDTLRFTDLNPNDIILTKSGKDMFIEIVGTDDIIMVKQQFFSTTFLRGIEFIEFADGSIWNRDDFDSVLAGNPPVSSGALQKSFETVTSLDANSNFEQDELFIRNEDAARVVEVISPIITEDDFVLETNANRAGTFEQSLNAEDWFDNWSMERPFVQPIEAENADVSINTLSDPEEAKVFEDVDHFVLNDEWAL